MKHQKKTIAFFLILLLLLQGCSKTSSSSKDGNSSITATPAAVTAGTEPSEGNDCTDEVCPIPTVNENNEPVYAIVSPVGYHAVEMIEQAQRLDTLDGKRIALVGGSFMASVTHDELRKCIQETYPTAQLYLFQDVGSAGPYSVFGQSSQTKAFQETLQELLIAGDSARNKFMVLPGGGYITIEIKLPNQWDDLIAPMGYEPLNRFELDNSN